MSDARAAELAGKQFNRLSRAQLRTLGMSDRAIAHRVATGRLAVVETAVFAIAPALAHDPWGAWMAATLTVPGTVLSHVSAAAAYGLWSRPRSFETVTRRGSGGRERFGGVLIFRSTTLEDECTLLRDVLPITIVERTLLDLAASVSARALARALREAIRLRLTTIEQVAEFLERARGRRGTRALAAALARYAGLPLERARSGAEVRALEILRAAGVTLPRLNVRIAGEEADLSWTRRRLIIEVDGGPFHLDAGEDARKAAIWTGAGWRVRRIDADAVYEDPDALVALATTNVGN